MDVKFQILRNLQKDVRKENPKKVSVEEINRSREFVSKNRNSVQTMPVVFKTFENGISDLAEKLGLSIAQEKALIDICDFSKGVQKFKVGYMVDKVGLSDLKTYKLLKFIEDQDDLKKYDRKDFVTQNCYSTIFSHNENYKYYNEESFLVPLLNSWFKLPNFYEFVYELSCQLNLTKFQFGILQQKL